MTFRHRLPTEQELTSLPPIDITADFPWDPNSQYSDPCLSLMPLQQDISVQVHNIVHMEDDKLCTSPYVLLDSTLDT